MSNILEIEMKKVERLYDKKIKDLEDLKLSKLSKPYHEFRKQCKHTKTKTKTVCTNYHDWQEDEVTYCINCGLELRRV